MTAVATQRPAAPAPPFCEVCRRTVETFQWETPVETLHDPHGGAFMHHTGEIIITVRCHGEVWSMSNWRGRLA